MTHCDFFLVDVRALERQLLTAPDKSAIQENLNQRRIDLQNVIDRRAAIGF